LIKGSFNPALPISRHHLQQHAQPLQEPGLHKKQQQGKAEGAQRQDQKGAAGGLKPGWQTYRQGQGQQECQQGQQIEELLHCHGAQGASGWLIRHQADPCQFPNPGGDQQVKHLADEQQPH